MEEGYDNNVQPGSCPEEENDYGASQYVNNLLHSEWEGEVMWSFTLLQHVLLVWGKALSYLLLLF